jgi:hypothetical protein
MTFVDGGMSDAAVGVRVDQQGIVVPCRRLQVEADGKGPAGWSVTAVPPAEAGGTDGLAWMVRSAELR